MNGINTDRGKPVRWFLAVLWSILFLYMLVVLKPSETSLVDLANSWSRRLGLPAGSLSKVAHVAGYVLWVILWCGVIGRGYRRPLPRNFLPWLPVLLLLLVAVPEGLQGLNSERHPSWMDVGFNAIGVAIGLAFRRLLVRREEVRNGERTAGSEKGRS